MYHNIIINDLTLLLGEELLFEHFTCNIYYCDRIFIIGNNGTGKSSLLKSIIGINKEFFGKIYIPGSVIIEYIPQILKLEQGLSGGQSFNQEFSRVLSKNPDILLLDEPTNHLDQVNQKSLINKLEKFPGTLIIVSHDVNLLSKLATRIWHINNNTISIFNGFYNEYIKKLDMDLNSIQRKLAHTINEQKKAKRELIKAQIRKQKNIDKGKKKYDNDKISAGFNKNSSEVSSGKKHSYINEKNLYLAEKISDLKIKDAPKITFIITGNNISDKNIVTISDGKCGYNNNPIINDVNLSIYSKEKILIKGNNGTGKSIFIKAIMGFNGIVKEGSWDCINLKYIGYIDQSYSNLIPNKTILESLEDIQPTWNHNECRKFLNNFMFSKNHQVHKKISVLSGGEKARVSLTLIAAKTPKLLILDEITNNLDISTKEYIIEVLKEYPSALILICHDENFTKQLKIGSIYEISNQEIKLV